MNSRQIIADLHNHSTASDGEYSPSELVYKGRDLGLKAIGLTDHDSIAGLDEFVTFGNKSGITVVPGVEVSLRFKRPFFVGTLHLLLYFSEALLNNSAFKKDLNDLVSQGRGMTLVKDRVDAINAGFGPNGKEPVLKHDLSIEEITSHGDNITRRHFFLTLSKNHNIEDKSTIDKLIGNNSPAYIPSGIDISLLKPFFDKYSVVKVLAHPAAGSFPGESHYKEVLPPVELVKQLLPEFLDPQIVGIDGLEVYYPAHTKELADIVLSWAKCHDLLITGGSDCHDSSNRPLGTAGINQHEFDKLMKKIG
jgi:predicted metal-dependent phosphoesterase TrpH